MLLVRDGDPAVSACCSSRHRDPVIHFLYRMVQNQAVAEELAQEVFLRVYRSGKLTSRRRSLPPGCSASRRTWR